MNTNNLVRLCFSTIEKWVYMPSPDGKVQAFVGEGKLGRVLVGSHNTNISGRVVLLAPPVTIPLTPQETERAMVIAKDWINSRED